MGGSQAEQSNAKRQDVFQRSRKQQSGKCMSDIEPLSKNSSVKKKVGLFKETMVKGVKRSEYPDVLDVLRLFLLKLPLGMNYVQ